MKIIDGKNAVLGRLASYVAKELLKGEEIAVLNCDEVLITGNKARNQERFRELRSKGGSSLKGPKHPKVSYRLVKRTIRGMLPEHRFGRGREAFKRVKCYNGVPKEFEDKEKISLAKEKKCRYSKIKEMVK